MVCWTLTTLIFWINSVHSELGTGMNYASEFLFLGFQTMFPGSRTVGTSTQIFSNRSWGHSCSYSASYLQSTQGFVIKIFKVITPSLQVGLVFLLYQWLMIHMSLPLWLFLFFDFSHFIMHQPWVIQAHLRKNPWPFISWPSINLHLLSCLSVTPKCAFGSLTDSPHPIALAPVLGFTGQISVRQQLFISVFLGMYSGPNTAHDKKKCGLPVILAICSK